MGKINNIEIGTYMQGNICNQKGDTIEAFKGVVVGFTKMGRVKIQNSVGKIRNFHPDETFFLKKDGSIGKD